jgi:hypothetical protein
MEEIKNFVAAAEPFIKLGELVALCLAVIAIWFARKQYSDSAHLLAQANDQREALSTVVNAAVEHARTLQQIAAAEDRQFKNVIERAAAQTAKLEAVVTALPTRFVGTFPGNLRPVTELVRNAESELIVLTDFIGYGCYSDPVLFSAYYRRLRQHAAIGRVDLRMTCYNRETGEKAIEYQFPRGDFATERAGATFDAFYHLHFPHLKEPNDWVEFDNQSWEVEEVYRHHLSGTGVNVFVTDRQLPFMLWLRDGKEAIVSFQNLTKFGDFSFRTTDPDFVSFFRKQALDVIAERYLPKPIAGSPLLAASHSSEPAEDSEAV